VPVERVPVERVAVERMPVARRVRGVPGVVRAPGLWLSGAGSRAVLCMGGGYRSGWGNSRAGRP
jgi:hypothetical protein